MVKRLLEFMALPKNERLPMNNRLDSHWESQYMWDFIYGYVYLYMVKRNKVVQTPSKCEDFFVYI
jgi:hypothetical protein